jgi:stage II sporulation protein P
MRLKRIILILIVLMLTGTAVVSAETELIGKYFTIKDQQNRVITLTSHQIVVGDEYLTGKNQLYRVYKVKDYTAFAQLVRQRKTKLSFFGQIKAFTSQAFGDLFRTEVKGRGPIAIYHTHSDESYEPSDGVSSRPAHGGIFDVGEVLRDAFEKAGAPAIQSKVPHDPHDAMAYDRSRRTAVQLLKERPSTLLDVHRDATPPGVYIKEIANQDVTQIQLVVGRQNPNFQATDSFARQIKAAVDRKVPGLIKGIFYGHGKYNQDLGPRTILLEFGSNTTTKEQAERAARLFAAASKDVLYGNVGSGAVNRGSFGSLLWILGALIVGVGIFIFLNRGGLGNLRKEFIGAIGEQSQENKDEEKSNIDQNKKSS